MIGMALKNPQEELQDNPANSWFGHYTLSGRLGIRPAIPDLVGWTEPTVNRII